MRFKSGMFTRHFDQISTNVTKHPVDIDFHG